MLVLLFVFTLQAGGASGVSSLSAADLAAAAESAVANAAAMMTTKKTGPGQAAESSAPAFQPTPASTAKLAAVIALHAVV